MGDQEHDKGYKRLWLVLLDDNCIKERHENQASKI